MSMSIEVSSRRKGRELLMKIQIRVIFHLIVAGILTFVGGCNGGQVLPPSYLGVAVSDLNFNAGGIVWNQTRIEIRDLNGRVVKNVSLDQQHVGRDGHTWEGDFFAPGVTPDPNIFSSPTVYQDHLEFGAYTVFCHVVWNVPSGTAAGIPQEAQQRIDFVQSQTRVIRFQLTHGGTVSLDVSVHG
jgi:hypothetical protein